MDIIIQVIQVIIALSLLLVWLVRPKMETAYRGGNAKNMKEEFAIYGLPSWFMVLIGILKVGFALLLIAGIWLPYIALISAIAIAVLMLGAIFMHMKVKDKLKKSLPAISLLILSLIVIIFSL